MSADTRLTAGDLKAILETVPDDAEVWVGESKRGRFTLKNANRVELPGVLPADENYLSILHHEEWQR